MTRWLLHMAKWSRRPPPMWKIKLVLLILAVSLAILGVEKMGWWPDWATAAKMRR